MKTVLLLVGKTQDKHFLAGIHDYQERIGHYMPFEIKIIPEIKNTKNLTATQQKVREGELILKELQSSDTVVLMDERGKELRSTEFARTASMPLASHQLRGKMGRKWVPSSEKVSWLNSMVVRQSFAPRPMMSE